MKKEKILKANEENNNNNPFEKMHFLICTSITHILKLLIKNGFNFNYNFNKKLFPTMLKMTKTAHTRVITRTIDRIVYKKR